MPILSPAGSVNSLASAAATVLPASTKHSAPCGNGDLGDLSPAASQNSRSCATLQCASRAKHSSAWIYVSNRARADRVNDLFYMTHLPAPCPALAWQVFILSRHHRDGSTSPGVLTASRVGVSQTRVAQFPQATGSARDGLGSWWPSGSGSSMAAGSAPRGLDGSLGPAPSPLSGVLSRSGWASPVPCIWAACPALAQPHPSRLRDLSSRYRGGQKLLYAYLAQRARTVAWWAALGIDCSRFFRVLGTPEGVMVLVDRCRTSRHGGLAKELCIHRHASAAAASAAAGVVAAIAAAAPVGEQAGLYFGACALQSFACFASLGAWK